MSTLQYPNCPADRVCDPCGPIPDSCKDYRDEMIKHSWIVVDTIEERNRLCPLFRVNGKVVKVNKVQVLVDEVLVTKSVCYQWNADAKVWDEYDVGGGGGGSQPVPVSEEWISF